MKVSVTFGERESNPQEYVKLWIHSDQGNAFNATYQPDFTHNDCTLLADVTALVKTQMNNQFSVTPTDSEILIFGAPRRAQS